MPKKIIVMSLGGSLIVPKHPNPCWLERWKEIIQRHMDRYKFAIVCGGGFVAREYISILAYEHKNKKEQSLAGIQATRMNARLMMQFFGSLANQELPLTMHQVTSALRKKDVVFCGALRYSPNQTSDSTAARLAANLKTVFINLTNIDGLYSANPKVNKHARFIPFISWQDFEKRAKALPYTPGQHFVLDQKAAEIIRKKRIKTYILGKKLENLDRLLITHKKFRGTVIGT